MHRAAFVLHFLAVAPRDFIIVGNLGKVMVVGLSAVSVGLGMCACDRIQLRGLGLGIFSHQAKEWNRKSIACDDWS